MKIKVLVENCAIDGFQCEHGLSLLLNVENKKVLFDFGQSKIFCDNAKKLDEDLANVDFAILSHGHYDHGGGLEEFCSLNHSAKIFASKFAFGDFWSSKFVGLSKNLLWNDGQANKQFVFVENSFQIDKNFSIVVADDVEKKFCNFNESMFEKVDGCLKKDELKHEMALIVDEKGKKTMFSGCSHLGIENLIAFAEKNGISNFVGGFHFKNMKMNDEDKSRLDNFAKIVDKSSIKFYTGHCTGENQLAFVNNLLKNNKIKKFQAGEILDL